VDFRSKLWSCPFCTARNHFPPHYAEHISEVNLPAELIPQFTTVEYELQAQASPGPPVFLFVVDTCLDEEELAYLRDALRQTLNLLPEESLVGLITFGTLVQVHELGFADLPKSYVFRGDKEYPPQKVQEMLSVTPTRAGLATGGPGSGPIPGRQPAVGRFLLPVAECTFALEQVLEDLQKDPWPCQADERVQRCTGAALSVALGLLEASVPKQGSRLMLFIAGPPTVGQGIIVNRSKKENIRSHLDLLKNQAPLHKPAAEFYRGLSDRAIANSIVVDVFACALDQVGTLELKPLVSRTGGLVVLADKFNQSVFRESLRRVFERLPDTSQLQMGFGGQIEVLHSREFKIAGAIGPCASLKKAGPTVSENEIGIG
jgi:protein transport protein SEC23